MERMKIKDKYDVVFEVRTGSHLYGTNTLTSYDIIWCTKCGKVLEEGKEHYCYVRQMEKIKKEIEEMDDDTLFTRLL